MGFLALDELQRRWGVARSRSTRVRAEVAQWRRPGEPAVWLMAPLTYMNLSGEAVRPFCSYHDIPPENTLVICDDHDLPWGRVRFRSAGSGAGHKGLASIQRHLGTDRYPRLRVGIRPATPGKDLAEYVLSPFFGEARELADIMVAVTADAVEQYIAEGDLAVMNRFNGLDLARTDGEGTR